MDDFNKFIKENIEYFNKIKGISSTDKFTWKDRYNNVEFEIKGQMKIKRLEDSQSEEIKSKPKTKCKDCGQELDYYENNCDYCLPCFDTNHNTKSKPKTK